MDPCPSLLQMAIRKLSGVTKTSTYIILNPTDNFGQIAGLADSPTQPWRAPCLHPPCWLNPQAGFSMAAAASPDTTSQYDNCQRKKKASLPGLSFRGKESFLRGPFSTSSGHPLLPLARHRSHGHVLTSDRCYGLNCVTSKFLC